ncbi:MAG: hypothetical protein DRN08_05615 [Thermoplasmata archaeon]|nr:MAG: hypothetical protein DRN08_05615 [Thermoplasmata archaeon]
MVTKRQLGIIVLVGGGLTLLAVFATDLFGAGQWSGFGPVQRIGLTMSVGAVLVGGILIRLGDRPA